MSIATALLVTLAGLTAPDVDPAADDPGLEPAGTRGEYFVIERQAGPDDAGTAEPATLGVLRHVHLAHGGVDWQAEQEQLLFGPELRLHQLERYPAGRARLVFREQARGRLGRTLRAAWPHAQTVPPLGNAERLRSFEPSIVEWFGPRRRERRYEGARGWRGPLALIERLRWGLEPDGLVARIEVLSGRPELVQVRTKRLWLPLGGVSLRVVELTGTEGESRGGMLFLERELAALWWQTGGPVARRVPRAVYERLAATHPLMDMPAQVSRAGAEAQK